MKLKYKTLEPKLLLLLLLLKIFFSISSLFYSRFYWIFFWFPLIVVLHEKKNGVYSYLKDQNTSRGKNFDKKSDEIEVIKIWC